VIDSPAPDAQTPPHSLDAERGVIGSILVDASVLEKVTPLLRASDFYNADHARLYRHALKLWNGGRGAVDLTLLKSAMENNGGWSNQDAALIVELFKLQPTALRAEHYAAEVRRLAECRQQIHVAQDLTQAARRGDPRGGTAAIDELRRITEQSTGIDYKPMSVAQLVAAKFELRYIVKGVLAAGQPCLVFGPQKVLKTSVLLELAVALALGRHFLGHFKVEESTRVAVMSGESGLPVIRETLLRIVSAAGYTADHLGNLIVTDQLPKFGQADHAEAMRRFILDNELQVVIIDPAFMAMAGAAQDAGNLFAQGELLRSMNEVFAELGATLILCHHAKKGNSGSDAYAPPELTNVAWSGFCEWARQWIMLGRRERYEPGTGIHRLWLSVGGSAGHSGSWALDIDEGPYVDATAPRKWNVELTRPEDARQAVDDRREQARETKAREQAERDKEKVVRAMAQLERLHPEGNSPSVIRDRSYLKGLRFTAALEAVVEEGHAIPVEVLRSNHRTPTVAYKLQTEEAST